MRNASNLINPNARAEGPPPDTFTAFFIWAFKGSFRYMALGSFLSVIAGVLEVLSALILGLVIDAALDVDPKDVERVAESVGRQIDDWMIKTASAARLGAV